MKLDLQQLSYSDAINLIDQVARSSGELPVDSGLAALFLGISESTLARLRQQGSGPAYLQYPEQESRSRNQKVNYLLRDLREWRDSKVVRSSMAAAVSRGMAFVDTHALTTRQPFWAYSRQRDARLVSHVLCSSETRFMELFTRASVVWIRIPLALERDWDDRLQKQKFIEALARMG